MLQAFLFLLNQAKNNHSALLASHSCTQEEIWALGCDAKVLFIHTLVPKPTADTYSKRTRVRRKERAINELKLGS